EREKGVLVGEAGKRCLQHLAVAPVHGLGLAVGARAGPKSHSTEGTDHGHADEQRSNAPQQLHVRSFPSLPGDICRYEPGLKLFPPNRPARRDSRTVYGPGYELSTTRNRRLMTLFVHDTHHVRGKAEEQFEAAYCAQWMPALAADGDARLLWYCLHAHGSGPA